MKQLIGSIIFVALLFTSCESENSSDVNQDRIYAVYTLIYDADEDLTNANARFHFGNPIGTPLKLTPPSYVELNNTKLLFKNTFAFYKKSFDKKILNGTFCWKDVDGEKYYNSVSLKEVSFPSGLTEISNDRSFELEWIGPAIGRNQSVSLEIDGDYGTEHSYITEDARGSRSIFIPKSVLRNFTKNRKATFRIEFVNNPDLDEPTSAGGRISGTYRVSKEIMIL